MKTPPIVSPQEWEAAREQLLVKEEALIRARYAMAAERRCVPRLFGCGDESARLVLELRHRHFLN
jgi:predicted dithiol-disulfide oxidoreductase (DUF899 family)